MVSPNIYHTVVFKLHPKVREMIDALDQSGQIDQDETKAPHLVSVDSPDSSVYRCAIIRNGQPETILIHTRRKVEPIRSWQEDGWVRPLRVIAAPEPEEGGRRAERSRRTDEDIYESLMDQILPRRR